MEKQIVKFSIDAETTDGEAVRCTTGIKIAGSFEFTKHVFARVFQQNPEVVSIIMEAILLSKTANFEQVSETITEEEYNDSLKNSDEDDKSIEF